MLIINKCLTNHDLFIDSTTSESSWDTSDEEIEAPMEKTRLFDLRDRILKSKGGQCAKYTLTGLVAAKKKQGK